MRILGISLVGFGIVALALSAVGLLGPIVGGGNVTIEGIVICLAIGILIGLPSFVGGIALVRRAEQLSQDVFTGKSSEQIVSIQEMRVQHSGPMDLVRGFDLNRLNWAGWALFLGTLAFTGLVICIITALVKGVGWQGPPPRILGVPVLVSAFAFFFAGRWLLSLYRVNIVRTRFDPPNS